LRSEGKIARTLGLKSQASSVKHQASSIKHQASNKHQGWNDQDNEYQWF
jgi:hypothetical protein